MFEPHLNERQHRVDWLMIASVAGLMCVGLLFIYSAKIEDWIMAVRTFTLGYSPCPNDTFIFYDLVHGRIETGGLFFREVLLDVETLNRKAFQGERDVTKVSLHAYGRLRDRYRLLMPGGAMGRGCGPLVVARERVSMEELRIKTIAVPGKLTTAYLLLALYDPLLCENIIVMPFDRIMAAVKDGSVDAGLIIHESRFTYRDFGLTEIRDLGEWWEHVTGLPIPLGCVIARRDIDTAAAETIAQLIRRSLEYAFAPPLFQMQQPTEAEGILLQPDEYSHYVRLAGNELKLVYENPGKTGLELAEGGLGMKDTLAKLFRTKEYQEESDGPDGGKARIIRSVVMKFREAAQKQLLLDSPELQRAVEAKMAIRLEKLAPVGR